VLRRGLVGRGNAAATPTRCPTAGAPGATATWSQSATRHTPAKCGPGSACALRETTTDTRGPLRPSARLPPWAPDTCAQWTRRDWRRHHVTLPPCPWCTEPAVLRGRTSRYGRGERTGDVDGRSRKCPGGREAPVGDAPFQYDARPLLGANVEVARPAGRMRHGAEMPAACAVDGGCAGRRRRRRRQWFRVFRHWVLTA
jgi:hypothetical protein